MSQWEKLIKEIYQLSTELRFDEIRKVLEHYGYSCSNTGGSHYVFRKEDSEPITIPVHGKIKKQYIKDVRDIIEREEKNNG